MRHHVAIFASVIAIVPILFFALARTDLHEVLSTVEAIDAKAPCQSMDEAFTRIWNRRKNTHAQYVNAKNSKINFTTVAPRDAYDYFKPEWNCEDEVRLGSAIVSSGDGPKFVCGSDVLASTEDCVVYSIGSNYDFSFEYAVNRIAPQCEIHL